MTYIIAYLVALLSCVACVWFGFWLGRMHPDAKPTVEMPTTYEGEVLDFAVYPDQVDDDE